MKEEVKARRLSESDFYQGVEVGRDDLLYVTEARRRAFAANPYLGEENPVFQWVGFVDGKPAGFNCIMPIHVCVDGRELRSTTGSSLNVADWARKSNLGLILPAKGVELTGMDGIAIAASCSQMAIPVHRINGYKYFFIPRYIALWKSRCVVERKLGGLFAKIVSCCVDLVIVLYAMALGLVRSCLLRGLKVHEVVAEDATALEQVAALVAADEHRFRECHDAKWFKWHLTNSFSEDGPCRLRVLEDSGRIVGFVMYKRRFHKQASSRGFRNVWLGSVVEWQVVPGYERGLKGMILHTVLKLRRNCDAVEFPTDDPSLGSFVRRLGWRRVGEANVGIKVWKAFPFFGDKSVFDQTDWRIRPAMGDNGLS